MQKEFDDWNKKKKEVNDSKRTLFAHPREIWWCTLGINVGVETDGTNINFERPVLVLKVFNTQSLLVIPLTRTHKDNKYYFKIKQKNDEKSFLVLSQVRLISSKRLSRKMRTIPENEFDQVMNLIKNSIL